MKSGHKNPPQLLATIKTGHRFRFVANGEAGSSSTITAQDLLDLLCMAVTPSSAYALLDGVKLKEIEVWSANSQGNITNTCEVEFVNDMGGFGASGATMSDCAIGVTNIAHVCARPPKTSLAGNWVNTFEDNSGDNANPKLFRLTCPQGSIVDVVCSLSLQDNDVARSVAGSVVGATAGFFYYRYLDSTSAKTLVPISANYI